MGCCLSSSCSTSDTAPRQCAWESNGRDGPSVWVPVPMRETEMELVAFGLSWAQSGCAAMWGEKQQIKHLSLLLPLLLCNSAFEINESLKFSRREKKTFKNQSKRNVRKTDSERTCYQQIITSNNTKESSLKKKKKTCIIWKAELQRGKDRDFTH